MVMVQGKAMLVKPGGIPAKNSSVNECEETTQSLESINQQAKESNSEEFAQTKKNFSSL